MLRRDDAEPAPEPAPERVPAASVSPDEPEQPPAVEGWVERAGRGDEDAWQMIVSSYSDRIFGLAFSRLRDRSDAAEVTQTVFVRVVEQLRRGGYTEQGRFEPWLFRIAMNLIRDEARARSRPWRGGALRLAGADDRSPGVELATPETDGGDFGGAGGAADGAPIDRLRDAIAMLPEADREILSLRYHGGLGFKAIAEALGEPVGTCLARHHRAVAKLRSKLGGETDTDKPGTDRGRDQAGASE